MDARITKQRLGNLLSYDWLKMLIAIAIAVCVIVFCSKAFMRQVKKFSAPAAKSALPADEAPVSAAAPAQAPADKAPDAPEK